MLREESEEGREREVGKGDWRGKGERKKEKRLTQKTGKKVRGERKKGEGRKGEEKEGGGGAERWKYWEKSKSNDLRFNAGHSKMSKC